MRVAFIIPWNSDEEGVEYSLEHHRTYWRNACYGVAQLATYVRGLGHEVLILDGQRDLLLEAEGDPAKLVDFTAEKAVAWKPDVVGVTGSSYAYPAVYRIVRRMLEEAKKHGFKVVLGGHHATAVPAACLNDFPELDCVFAGPGEISFTEYLAGREKASIPGLYCFENGTVTGNGRGNGLPVAETPFPDWSLLDTAFYLEPNIFVHRSKSLLRNLDTIAGYGCNKKCAFCNPSWHGHAMKVEYRPPESIVERLETLMDEFGIEATMFHDSTLTGDRNFIEELCRLFIDRGINEKLVWTACARADQVDEPLAALMRRAGCSLLFIGFESASDRLLRLMRKGTTQAVNKRCSQALENAGLPYWASFIVGYPSETEEELLASFQFAMEMSPFTGWPNEFNPAPGSQIFNDLVKENKLSFPHTPEEWFAITGIGRKGKVLDGYWSAMEPVTFRAIVKEFKKLMQYRLDINIQREIIAKQERTPAVDTQLRSGIMSKRRLFVWGRSGSELSGIWQLNNCQGTERAGPGDGVRLVRRSQKEGHVATPYFPVLPPEGWRRQFELELDFSECREDEALWKIQVQNKEYQELAEIIIEPPMEAIPSSTSKYSFYVYGYDTDFRLVFSPISDHDHDMALPSAISITVIAGVAYD